LDIIGYTAIGVSLKNVVLQYLILEQIDKIDYEYNIIYYNMK